MLRFSLGLGLQGVKKMHSYRLAVDDQTFVSVEAIGVAGVAELCLCYSI